MLTKSEILDFISGIADSEIVHIIEQLETYGIVSDYNLSISRVVFDQAGKELIEHLKTEGFSGDLFIIGRYIDYVGNVYAIYDTSRFEMNEAREWLLTNSLAAQEANIAEHSNILA